MAEALRALTSWCSDLTLSLEKKAGLDEEGSNRAKVSERLRRAKERRDALKAEVKDCYKHIAEAPQAEWLCGGETVDVARKSKAATSGEHVAGAVKQKRTRNQAKGPRELVFNPPLPDISDSYDLTPGDSELGILREAFHKESRQKRAVLLIPKRNIPPSSSEDHAADIKKHLETLLRVDHVNILPLFEACEDYKYIYLVYEWPQGGLMLHYLCQHAEIVTELHLASIVREVLSAVFAANKFGIHHMDWSLLCIFLGYKNRFSPVKVLGFGLAGILIPLVTSRRFSRSNKHFYASPEMFIESYKSMSHGKMHTCDVWSVGTVVFTLFAGRPPFCGSYSEVKSRVKKGHWSFGHEFDVIGRQAKELVEFMLTRHHAARPSAHDLLKHPFLQQQQPGVKRAGEAGICQDALTKLEQFARETHTKQTLARLLADLGLESSMYADLEEKFRLLDLDGNGLVETSELLEVASRGMDFDPETIQAIVEICDRNGNSTIDISEFISAVVLELENKDENLLFKAFEKMDVNRDARITKGEIFKVLRQYSGSLEAGDVSDFVKDIDKDKDDKIDYNEFRYLFPHMREKNAEVKETIKRLLMDKVEVKEKFGKLQKKIDEFMSDLRVHAGRMTLEHARLSDLANARKKPKFKEQEVLEACVDKLSRLMEVITHFAGKKDDDDDDEDPRAKRRRQNTQAVPGLAVLGRTDDEEGGDQDHGRDRSGSNVSGSGSESDDEALGSGRSGSDGGANEDSQKDKNKMSIAEKYTFRSMTQFGGPMTAHNLKLLKAHVRVEGIRRRHHLWLGGGEGIKHVRTQVLGQAKVKADAERARERIAANLGDMNPDGMFDQDELDMGIKSARSNSSTGSFVPVVTLEQTTERETATEREETRKAVGGTAETETERNDTTERVMEATGHITGEEPTSPSSKQVDPEELLKAQREAEIRALTPWSNKKKRMQLARVACTLAEGHIIKHIGSVQEDQVKKRLKTIREALFKEYSLHKAPPVVNANVDGDFDKMMRYKCLRSWLPPLILLKEEMERCHDTRRVHVFERRSVHLDGVCFIMQHIERIMFSLSEFMFWQEEGFKAQWTLEDMSAPLPTNDRFLPPRVGDVDEMARTPRDDEDAEALVDEEIVGEAQERDASMAADPHGANSSMQNRSLKGSAVGFTAETSGSKGSRNEMPARVPGTKLDRNAALNAKTRY